MTEIRNIPRSLRTILNRAAHKVGLAAAEKERSRLFAEIELQRKDELDRFNRLLAGVDEPPTEKVPHHEK